MDEKIDGLPNQRSLWDAEYRAKGRLWGKIPHEQTLGIGDGIFLELGCGSGKNLKRSEKGLFRIGLDFSLQALHFCRTNPELSDISYICADVRYLPFKDETIHSSDAHHVFGHLLAKGRSSAAFEIARVLKRNGELLVTVFGTGDFRNGMGLEVENGTYLKGNEIITHYFTRDELHALFSVLSPLSSKSHTWIMRVKDKCLPRFVWTIKYVKTLQKESVLYIHSKKNI